MGVEGAFGDAVTGRARLCDVDGTPSHRTCTGPNVTDALSMGKQVSVYVRDEDVELWERAERFAKARRLPMSALVMTALESYLAEHDDAG